MLAAWARSVGVHRQTAYAWVREVRMPVPFRRRARSWSTSGKSSGEQRVVLYPPVAEVGSGFSGERPMLAGVVSDPCATVIGVEHRDRLARFGVEHLRAAVAAPGRRMVIVDDGEITDDVVRDMIGARTAMGARRYGRRGARNRAVRAVTAAKRPNASGSGGLV